MAVDACFENLHDQTVGDSVRIQIQMRTAPDDPVACLQVEVLAAPLRLEISLSCIVPKVPCALRLSTIHPNCSLESKQQRGALEKHLHLFGQAIALHAERSSPLFACKTREKSTEVRLRTKRAHSPGTRRWPMKGGEN